MAGRALPRKVTVTPSIMLSHSRESNFADAHEYRPDRFLTQGEVAANTWIPFGGGVRRCIGAAFSLMEGAAVLGEVLRRYEVTADQPAPEPAAQHHERPRRQGTAAAPCSADQRTLTLDGWTMGVIPADSRRSLMPKYMIEAAYSPDGLKGVIAKGGSSRREAIQAMAESLGGSVDALYFAFGDSDVFVVIDMPDNVSTAAVMMTVSASGALSNAKTTVLLTPEDVDEAAQKSVDYSPPGS